MKKNLLAVCKGRKKRVMVASVYVLLVLLLSVGVVGCSKEKTVSAKTRKESVVASEKTKVTKNTEESKKTEVKEEQDTHGEDEVEENAETKETKSSSKSMTKSITSSSSGKKESSSSGSSSSTSKNEETSSSSSTNKKEEDKHTHSWEPVYKEVDHGYWTQELVKAAWTEEIPQYTMIYRTFCNGCGLDITDCVTEHTKSQMLAGNFACGGYTDKPVKTQTGTKTVEHPAEYQDVWVPKMEKVSAGYKCSGCGATK